MKTASVTITGVREAVVSVGSPMRNAYVSFSTMTCSVIGVTARRGDRTYTGLGYTSNGRYAQSGLLRDRFIPRLLAADPGALADEAGENLDPRTVRRILMQDEKPGGHGERSVAVGGLEMAIWDLAAKIAGQPGHVFIAERYGSRRLPTRSTCTRRAATTSPTPRRASCARSCGGTWTSATRS